MSPEMLVVKESLVRQFAPVIPDESRLDWAKTISGWTIDAANKGLMLPKTPAEIIDLFNKKHSLVMVNKDGNLLSHAGATFEYPDNSIEIGALCGDAKNGGKGFGRPTVLALLTHLRSLYPDKKFIVLANKESALVFKRLGGAEIKPSDLHQDVWLACKKVCPKRPSMEISGKCVACPDTPYDLTNFAKAERVSIFNVRTSANGGNGSGNANI